MFSKIYKICFSFFGVDYSKKKKTEKIMRFTWQLIELLLPTAKKSLKVFNWICHEKSSRIKAFLKLELFFIY